MATRWYFIEANDVLMFRDSRRFTAGTNFTARSMFPPNPRTVYGMLRTHLIEVLGNGDFAAFKDGRLGDLHRVLGTPQQAGTLRLHGVYLAKRDNQQANFFVRPPLDLLRQKSKEPVPMGSAPSLQIAKVQPIGSDFVTDLPFNDWQPLLAEGQVSEVDGWLDSTGFDLYLDDKTTSNVTKDEDLFEREMHTGLGMDHSVRRGKDSLFYQAEYIRLRKDVGLLIGISGDDGKMPQSGMINIGGEGRTAFYQTVQVKTEPTRVSATSGRVKIVLLTPAYFSGGWQPQSNEQPRSSDWSPWVGAGKLVSLAIGKPQIISGWDLVNKRPRPVRHFLPAGSVFYFENAAIPSGVQTFTETPNGDLDYGTMGFGAFAATSW